MRIKRSASQSLERWRSSIAESQPCRHPAPHVMEAGIGVLCGKCKVVLVADTGGVHE